jgi:osmotically-inducible protein OsmY
MDWKSFDEIRAQQYSRTEREVRRIRIDVRDGVVTLSGAVGSPAERRSIVGAARFTSGVRSVEDKLHVEPG